jgi:hypothetical protein
MLPPEWFWKAVTVLIASWAAWSGWQQHRIARDKLRLDLFEKRLAVFEEIKHAITAAHDRSEVDLPRFQRAAAASTFLFGSEIHSYMREVQQKLKEVKDYGANIRAAAAMYPSNAEMEIAIVAWLKTQPDRSVDLFGPYLSFSEAKRR